MGKGECYKSGHPGHLARDCQDPRPFQGHCTICGNWGHTAKFCQVGRIGEVDNEGAEPEQEDDRPGSVNEFGIGGLYLGGGVDSLEPGWSQVIRKGKRIHRTCMGSICNVDRRTGPKGKIGE